MRIIVGVYEWLSIVGAVGVTLGGIICIILWYLLTNTMANMRSLDTALQAHKLDVAITYAKQRDVDSHLNRLNDRLTELQASINRIDVSMSAVAENLKNMNK